ncbi:Rne/Rng family ribonuclease [Candidatus Fermentibacteria bacterium]|nr:Rne/Rng family ribonuclease [Candidatus Fermentibacteria bacterium]
MRTEVFINADPRETRVAVLEDGKLVELWVERADNLRMMGDIYVGAVQSVLPGMQAAFVDLGHERAGFLHVSDMTLRPPEGETAPVTCTAIGDLLKEGQRILVQVVKEPTGTKGPRLSTMISLPGRYAVLIPQGASVGISRRIADGTERERLRSIGAEVVPPDMGLILRTMAQGVESHVLAEDVKNLVRKWSGISRRAAEVRGPMLLHREDGVGMSAVRDTFGADVDRLVVDDRTLYRAIVRSLEGASTTLRDRVELYEHDVPVFEYFGVERELQELISRRVTLPKGGSLVIEQTEALVVVDVNTGRYAGGRDLEETVFNTNMEAADEIARQLRLRDLGGIIVIDFIDMEDLSHREQLVGRLQAALTRDRAHTRVLPVSELGVVEMTRERIRPSHADTMMEPCPACDGTGRVMSLLSSALDLDRRLRSIMAAGDAERVCIEVSGMLNEYLAAQWGERWEQTKRECTVVVGDSTAGYPKEPFRVIT